jgi:4-hydroxy-2-oxoheptanedioate aldolase
MYPAPGVVERIGPDWDWVWIDGQHGELGYNDVLALVRACDLIARPAVVRVPGHEFGSIGLALDTGAAGLIVPCVDTPEQARAVVDAAKFPPLGKRSFGGRRPIDRLGRIYSDTANEDVLLVVQVESPQAIENAEQIAAIAGVDALFLGPDDVLLRRGHSVNEKRSEANLGKDMRAVMDACNKHGKFSVMVAGDEEMLKLCAAMGFSMIVGGGDVPFLAVSSKQASAKARAILEQQSEADRKPATRDDEAIRIY